MIKIQINTDANIKSSVELEQRTEGVVKNALAHLAKHVSRVEVHLSDQNGEKTGGRDKRCMIEARVEGRQPIAVSEVADNIGEAITGAADKLKSMLDHTIGRSTDH